MIIVRPEWYDFEKITSTAKKFLKQNGDEKGFTAADIPPCPKFKDGIPFLITNLPDRAGVPGIIRTLLGGWNLIDAPDFSKSWVGPAAAKGYIEAAPGLKYKPGIYWAKLHINDNGAGTIPIGAEGTMVMAYFFDMLSSYHRPKKSYLRIRMNGLVSRQGLRSDFRFNPCVDLRFTSKRLRMSEYHPVNLDDGMPKLAYEILK